MTSKAERKAVKTLSDHLAKRNPPQQTIAELAKLVPGQSVPQLAQRHPSFFSRVGDHISLVTTTGNTGYRWRQCTNYYFGNGSCPQGKKCLLRHGDKDPRNVPSQQAKATPPPPAAKKQTQFNSSQSQSKPAPPAPKTGQNKQPAAPLFNAAPTTNSTVPQPAAMTYEMPAAYATPIASESPAKRKVGGKNCYLVPEEKMAALCLSELINQSVIAVDCEGVNLGPGGELCLVQISTQFNVYVFDLCSSDRDTSIAILKAIFKSSSIKKILHDARNDNEALLSVGIINENFEDTQVLYGVLMGLRGRPEKRIGLKPLLEKYNFGHSLKATMQDSYASDPALWSRRPLTEEKIQYAAQDVVDLLAVYQYLKNDIEAEIVAISRNYATPAKLKLIEKTYADATTTPLDTKLRLFFNEENRPDRRIPEDTFLEEVAPTITNNTNVEDENAKEEARLLSLFPDDIREAILAEADSRPNDTLIEIVVDLGRVPRVRFTSCEVSLNNTTAVREIDPFVKMVFENSQRNDFSRENRIGIEGSLHRISAIKNADGRVIGLTYRIGRHLPRSAEIITDLIARVSPALKSTVDHAPQNLSILLLGPPGVGKTTLLREVARLLADEYDQRVMIVDTSNEIGGDGDIAHACIGRARRMPVVDKALQHNTMVEAVQNHNPTVIVIDEIGTPKEVVASKTISQRGVSLIGTAHGTSFDSLMKNPELLPLLGGIREVFLSDKEAVKNSDGTKSKVKHERGGAPTFSIIIEIITKNKLRIYDDVAKIVDAKLNRMPYVTELRWFEGDKMYTMFEQHNSMTSGKGSGWLSVGNQFSD